MHLHDPNTIKLKNALFYQIEDLKRGLLFGSDGKTATTKNPCELSEWADLLDKQRIFNDYVKEDKVAAYLIYSEKTSSASGFVTRFYLKEFYSLLQLDTDMETFFKGKQYRLIEIIEM